MAKIPRLPNIEPVRPVVRPPARTSGVSVVSKDKVRRAGKNLLEILPKLAELAENPVSWMGEIKLAAASRDMRQLILKLELMEKGPASQATGEALGPRLADVLECLREEQADFLWDSFNVSLKLIHSSSILPSPPDNLK